MLSSVTCQGILVTIVNNVNVFVNNKISYLLCKQDKKKGTNLKENYGCPDKYLKDKRLQLWVQIKQAKKENYLHVEAIPKMVNGRHLQVAGDYLAFLLPHQNCNTLHYWQAKT